MLYEIKLSIKDYAILKIYTNLEELRNKFMDQKVSIKRTIPITDISINTVCNNYVEYSNSIIVVDSTRKKMYYDKEYNVSILNTTYEELRFPDLVYVALSMFSKILAKNNKYLLHSSALLHSSSGGFVLVGDANAGKTSLAYELMSKHNCKLISNDHTIIGIEDGKAMILGGTKEIQMRLGATELYFPLLYQKVNIKDDDKWNKKIIVNDYISSDLILQDGCDKALLTNVFSISTSNKGEAFIRRKDKIDEFLFLYEGMSKIIKGTYNYITGFDYPMPTMEDAETLYNLSQVCKIIVNQCDVSEAKGSVSDLGKVLIKKYEK